MLQTCHRGWWYEMPYAAVTAFEAKYPDVDIFVDDIQWQDYRDRLLKGECDIVDSPLLRTAVARKRNISNPLAALFFEESKLLL